MQYIDRHYLKADIWSKLLVYQLHVKETLEDGELLLEEFRSPYVRHIVPDIICWLVRYSN